MSKKKNKPFKIKSSPPESVAIKEKDWSRTKYGVMFIVAGLLIVLALLFCSEYTHLPFGYKYEPQLLGQMIIDDKPVMIFDGDIPEHYDWMEYLVTTTSTGWRWERRLYMYQQPAPYLALLIFIIGIAHFLPEKKRKKEIVLINKESGESNESTDS